ncbi:restriction endonuclease subunit S [Streptococcus suis]|nr:restriction endonuclease subunit S [Streptococcus suis]
MTKEKPTEPRLRFPGFTDAWKQRKLGEVVDVCSGRDYKHLEAGSIPVYGTGGYMLSVSEALSENVDAIGIGRKGTIDSPYILKAPFWTVDTLFYCLPKKNFALEFAYAVFQNVNWKSMDESTGVPSLSKVRINNVKVLTPKLQEQEAIGSFFADLDQLITLHQRKLDDVKELKKALLQKMFPKGNGNDFPELRFPEFTDAWKQRKLGEVCSIQGGNAWKSDSYSLTGEYLVVTIANVTGEYFIDDKKGNRIDINPNEMQYVLRKGDILISLTGNVGRVSKMTESKGVLNQRVGKLMTTANLEFIFSILRTEKFENEMRLASQGAAQANISNKDVLQYMIFFPALPEQEAIGSFFSDLDQLITLHQRQLDHLKLLKKALLQQMFI